MFFTSEALVIHKIIANLELRLIKTCPSGRPQIHVIWAVLTGHSGLKKKKNRNVGEEHIHGAKGNWNGKMVLNVIVYCVHV